MERRGFLKGALVVAGSAVSTKFLFGDTPSEIKKILTPVIETPVIPTAVSVNLPIQSPAYSIMDSDILSKTLTEGFFKYLESNPIDFKYTRVDLPSFLLFYVETEPNGDKLLNSSAHVIHTRKTKAKYSSDMINDLHACHHDFAESSIHNMIYEFLAKELALEKSSRGDAVGFAIYQLVVTPVIYDPQSFNPTRAIMIRCAEVPENIIISHNTFGKNPNKTRGEIYG